MRKVTFYFLQLFRLGLPHSTIPQNTGGVQHDCGNCTWGCPLGIKQSAVHTWLKDAQNAGADIIKNCRVDRVLYEEMMVTGVEATEFSDTSEPKRFRLNAKVVVVCCGSLNSPGTLFRTKLLALLLRSGLKNQHIGKNLRLHPVAIAQAYFHHLF